MDYIALNEKTETCGAIIWWSLTGNVNVDELRAALLMRAGLPEDQLPKPISARLAFSRSLRSIESKQLFARTISAGKHALVLESFDNEGRSIYNAIGDVHFKGEGFEVFPRTEEDREAATHADEEIAMAMRQHAETLTASDISGFIVKQLEELGAVSLRDRGGVYFVPNSSLKKFEELSAVLGSMGQRIFQIPAVKNEDAVEAVVTSLTSSIQKELSAFDNYLEEEDHGKRALANKSARVDTLADRVRLYESTLGVQLESLQEALAGIEVRLAGAALALMQGDD